MEYSCLAANRPREEAARSTLPRPIRNLRRTDDTFTLKIRSKPVVVSVDRLKPAILSQPTSQQQQETAKPEPPDITSPEDPPLADRQHRTRSGRQVRFQQEDDYEYF